MGVRDPYEGDQEYRAIRSRQIAERVLQMSVCSLRGTCLSIRSRRTVLSTSGDAPTAAHVRKQHQSSSPKSVPHLNRRGIESRDRRSITMPRLPTTLARTDRNPKRFRATFRLSSICRVPRRSTIQIMRESTCVRHETGGRHSLHIRHLTDCTNAAAKTSPGLWCRPPYYRNYRVCIRFNY